MRILEVTVSLDLALIDRFRELNFKVLLAYIATYIIIYYNRVLRN